MARKFPCPKCGTENPIGQTFCIGCGEKFEYKIAGEEQISPVLPGAPPPYIYPPMPPTPPVEPSHTGAWAFLGAVVTIVCIGALFFLIAIGSESEPNGGVTSKGFSFKQLLPGPSLPPPVIKSPPEYTPQPEYSGATPESSPETTESSRYSKDLVIAVAKKVSPECRVERVG